MVNPAVAALIQLRAVYMLHLHACFAFNAEQLAADKQQQAACCNVIELTEHSMARHTGPQLVFVFEAC
jgi:hypothetical protein